MKKLYHIKFPKSTQFSKRNNEKWIDFIKKVCYNNLVNNIERIFLWQTREKMITMLPIKPW